MAQKHQLRDRTGLKLVGFLISLGLLSSCSQMPGDGLFTDAQSSVCPPGCASSLKADDGQMYIKFSNTNTVQLRAGTTRVDIGGECYPSLYPANAIFVTVANNSSPKIWGVTNKTTTPICKNGKFDISVDLNALPAVGTYILRVQLIAYDKNGVAHFNASEGVADMTVIRTNVAP